MGASKSYAIRAAGSPSRPGKIWKTYPYDLRSLVLALDEARWHSLYNGPHVVTVVTGRCSKVIRVYEHGETAWARHRALCLHRHWLPRRSRSHRKPG
jgi:hypothetical protein